MANAARSDLARPLARLRPEAWLGDRSYLFYRALFFGTIAAACAVMLIVLMSGTQRRTPQAGTPAGAALRAPSDAAQRPVAGVAVPLTGPRPRISAVDAYRVVVYIANLGTEPADLTGWRLVTPTPEGRLDYRFPPGFGLAPDADVRVHTGEGVDSLVDLYWRLPSGTRAFDPRGDSVSLVDLSGREVSRYTFSRR